MKQALLKRYKHFVYTVEVLLVLVGLALVYNFLYLPKGDKTFYLPSQDRQVLYNTLKKNHYHLTFIDKYIFQFVTMPTKGWYHISHTYSGRFDFFAKLHSYRQETKRIKIYPAESAEELCNRIAKQLHLDPKLLHYTYTKYSTLGEGDILAGEYLFPLHSDEEGVIKALFFNSNQNLKAFEQKYENITKSKIAHKVLFTIASIIQKESNNIKEMPLISSVIYNRLAKNMKLQMDGTLNYGKYSHTIINHERIKTDMSPYNTYKYKGLPPTPLCTISIEALEAAYLPATTDYLFFMLTKDGSHTFAADYKTHLKNIRTFKKHKIKKERTHTASKNIDSNSTDTNQTDIPSEKKHADINSSEVNASVE